MRNSIGFVVAGFVSLVAGSALAKDCELKLEGNDAMQYNTKELVVAKDCTNVKITLKHSGKLPKAAMGHNVVISTDKDTAGVTGDGAKAGVANDYVPKDDKRVIASTKLVGGGEETSTTFKADALKAGESYKFYCTFPGHAGVMVGVLVVK